MLEDEAEKWPVRGKNVQCPCPKGKKVNKKEELEDLCNNQEYKG